MTIAQRVRAKQNDAEMLRRSLERIIQLYTDKAHFIYELLQNAEDAQATVIKFNQMDEYLEVYHNGTPFTEENLSSLCDIGASDKVRDYNKIGEFGVGFKSVFGICNKVRLHSAPRNGDRIHEAFAVEIRDFTVPSDIRFEPIPEPYTTRFVFPYCVGESFSGYKTINALKNAIADRLNNLGVTTLLFMQHLGCIEYDINCESITGSGCYMLDNKKITSLCSLITAIGETNGAEEELSYLKYSKIIPSIEEANKSVDIAYPVIIEKDGGYRFQKATTPYISVYFPTETESKIPIIAQGPYRTTPNRSSIPFDDEENIMLAKLTAELLYESVLDIKAQGQLSLQLLNILPLTKPDNLHNWLFTPLYEKTIELFENETILPTAHGDYVTARLAKIARGQDLITIFEGELLKELINEEEYNELDDDEDTSEDNDCLLVPYKWLPGQLTENNKELSSLYYFLTNKLNIEVIRPEDLRYYFRNNRTFFSNRDDSWLEKFYKYLEKISSLVNPNDGRNMLLTPFVKTSDNRFVAPFRRNGGNYLPNVFVPVKDPTGDFQYIHPYLADQCNNFFTNVLRLTQPDRYELFKKTIQRRYIIGISNIEVTDEEHVEDVKTALEYLSINKYKNDMQETLSRLCFIRCNGRYIAQRIKDIYFEISDEGVSTKIYFALDDTISIADTDFYSENNIDRKDLSLLGVKGTLISGTNFRGWYASGEGNTLWYDVGDFRAQLDFIGIDYVISFIQNNPQSELAKKRSKVIMQLLFWAENKKYLMGEIIKGKTSKEREKAHARIIDVLTHGRGAYYTRRPKWLFDKNGRLVNPAEISKHDLDTKIYGELKRDSNVYDILGFMHTEKDEFEEAITNIACMLERDEQPQYSILERLLALVEKYKPGAKSYGNTNAEDEYFHQDVETWEYDFPSRPIKNLGSLKESVERQYFSAPKVEYEIRPTSTRISEDKEKNRQYLRAMYSCVDNPNKYICQICKISAPFHEAVQIEKSPILELSQMNLFLCPNCAEHFRRNIRNDFSQEYEFIQELFNADETQDEPVCVSAGSVVINFTATHLAEIKEILKLNAMHQINDDDSSGD